MPRTLTHGTQAFQQSWFVSNALISVSTVTGLLSPSPPEPAERIRRHLRHLTVATLQSPTAIASVPQCLAHSLWALCQAASPLLISSTIGLRSLYFIYQALYTGLSPDIASLACLRYLDVRGVGCVAGWYTFDRRTEVRRRMKTIANIPARSAHGTPFGVLYRP